MGSFRDQLGMTTRAHQLVRALQASAPIAGPDKRAYLWIKRGVDIVVSAVAIILLAPVFLVIAVLIKLDSAGPAIFAQERMGYDWRTRRQRPFKTYKFRSMFHGCDQGIHQQLITEWVRGQHGAPEVVTEPELVKLTNDARVTRVGRVLRKTSLDELPQLWNVLKGDMSLVGPRPVPLYEVAEYAPGHLRRLEATPGITGLWQIRGRGVTSFEDMVQMDVEYIERQSLWLDLGILILTIPAVLSRRGAI